MKKITKSKTGLFKLVHFYDDWYKVEPGLTSSYDGNKVLYVDRVYEECPDYELYRITTVEYKSSEKWTYKIAIKKEK